MEQAILEKYIKAGRIAAEIKKAILATIKPGMKLLDLAEQIENRIKKNAKIAFPVNIGINEVAAHYTPTINDPKIINPRDLVKIDFGMHVDGYIADLAFTWCSEKNELIKASEEALQAGIDVIRPNITISEISKAIEQAIKKYTFGAIVNLTGHGLDQYVFHGEPSIPNVSTNLTYKLKEGDVIALEPFVSKTAGYVKESEQVEIYQFLQDKPVRLKEARGILTLAKIEYNKLPFAKRWLAKRISPIKLSLALKELESTNALKTYPILKEVENKPIAQAEDTIIVADPPIVTTRLKG